MDLLERRNENIVDSVTHGIKLKNIPHFISLVRRSLGIKKADTFDDIANKIELMANECVPGGSRTFSVKYTQADRRNFAIFHCIKTQSMDPKITIAYAIHSISGVSEKEMDVHQEQEAAARLRQLGFEIPDTINTGGAGSGMFRRAVEGFAVGIVGGENEGAQLGAVMNEGAQLGAVMNEGAQLGAVIGTMILPGIGTAIGAIIGSAFGASARRDRR